jgi:hypothetical protein
MQRVPDARRAEWAGLTDTELLQQRFCDLKLKLRGTALETRLQRVHGEMARRGLRFRPHMWLSEEWFSPDGVPGIAVPFYLAHPRLMRLERRMMRQVEGGNQKWMLRILRHEVGHAIDTAYRLRRKARWRELFGPARQHFNPIESCARAERRKVEGRVLAGDQRRHRLGRSRPLGHPEMAVSEGVDDACMPPRRRDHRQ